MTDKPETTLFDFDAVFDVDDYLYFYADELTDERSDVETASIVKLLELDTPCQILDLACGFGRHANRLAALGHQVTGIDLTPGFLEIARREAQHRNIKVTYLHGDMRQLNYTAAFDRVILAFTAFGYFEDEENIQVLQNIAGALRSGGLLLFDINNRDTFLRCFLPYIVTEKEGNLMIDRITYDPATGRLYNRRIVIRNGVRKDKPFFIRMYNPNEICDCLVKAGLRVHHLYGGWDGQPLSLETRRMVVVAVK